jgi:integrase/recombinase XerC
MLQPLIAQFLAYCQLANFSARSIQALEIRLRELRFFVLDRKLPAVADIGYLHLVEFTAQYRQPSIHVRKSRVWALRQFFHFLALHDHAKNISAKLPYPKIEKTVPQFLTREEYHRLIVYFTVGATSPRGLRNLVAFLLLAAFGLRTSSLLALNADDIDLSCGLIWLKEKGRRQRSLILPTALFEILQTHLDLMDQRQGPLLITRRAKRLSSRSLQNILREAAERVGIDKSIHARLFRHSAATHLNRVAGIEITQHVLGHSRRANTIKYAHLNPDQYAAYMQRHPYMMAVSA